jgi:hypothetical protein
MFVAAASLRRGVQCCERLEMANGLPRFHAPSAVVFIIGPSGLAFSEKPIHLSLIAEGRTRCPQRVEKMQ